MNLPAEVFIIYRTFKKQREDKHYTTTEPTTTHMHSHIHTPKRTKLTHTTGLTDMPRLTNILPSTNEIV